MDIGPWQATVHWVTKSWTQLNMHHTIPKKKKGTWYTIGVSNEVSDKRKIIGIENWYRVEAWFGFKAKLHVPIQCLSAFTNGYFWFSDACAYFSITSGHGKGKDKIITPMIGINFLNNLFLSFYNRPFCGSLGTRSPRKENKNETDLNVERWSYHDRRVDNSDIEKVYLIKKDKSKVGHPPSFQ